MAGLICGIDEAGRGPLAGPVTAAAVILPETFPVTELGDSKVLPPKRREELCRGIMENALSFGVGWAWPEEIDRLNIHHATLLAMSRAFAELTVLPESAIIDGLYVPELPVPGTAVVNGDAIHPEIMAASIVAKTVRDRWMVRYSWLDGRYGFEQHKGYATRLHREKCRIHGLCSIHRRSFRILQPDLFDDVEEVG